MLFVTKTGMKVYLPSGRTCVAIRADLDYANVWCAGENEAFEVTKEEAERIQKKLVSKEEWEALK